MSTPHVRTVVLALVQGMHTLAAVLLVTMATTARQVRISICIVVPHDFPLRVHQSKFKLVI